MTNIICQSSHIMSVSQKLMYVILARNATLPKWSLQSIFYSAFEKKQKRKEQRDGFINKYKEADSKVLTLKFDYSQNCPTTKLNVNNQLYKRMFWLYCFNIHVFKAQSSYCYTYTECDGVKNPNSVIYFLNGCLKKVLPKFPDITTIVLLSDAAGGQNINFLMPRFPL